MSDTRSRVDARSTTDSGAEITVVPKRHPGRWFAAVVILLICARLLWSIFTNERFGWDVVGQYLFTASILNGLQITIMLTLVGMTIGISLGIVLAVMRLSNNPVLRNFAAGYVFWFRGTPLLVQLLFWYNLAALYPTLTFGLPWVSVDAAHILTPLVAAILGLGLNEGAYMAEIVRGGIQSVGKGQSEAAGALGMQKLQTMRRIVLPQAMRSIVPPTGNEVINMLKDSALVSVMAVPELLYSVQIIYSRNFQTIPLLIVASIWYLLVTAILSVGQHYVERWYGHDTADSTPPLQSLRRLFQSRILRTGN